MSAPHIILDNSPSLCQKLSDLVECWRSYNKNNFACFFETRCIKSGKQLQTLSKSNLTILWMAYMSNALRWAHKYFIEVWSMCHTDRQWLDYSGWQYWNWNTVPGTLIALSQSTYTCMLHDVKFSQNDVTSMTLVIHRSKSIIIYPVNWSSASSRRFCISSNFTLSTFGHSVWQSKGARSWNSLITISSLCRNNGLTLHHGNLSQYIFINQRFALNWWD